MALVDVNTCIFDCEACCETWPGITVDALPNVMTPNGDGVNDYWEASDEVHPYCAFGANHFDLWIFNRWGGQLIAHRSGEGYCCPFISQAPGINIVGSINWDGRADGGFLSAGSWAPDGDYEYVLELQSNCGGSADFAGYFQILDGQGANGGSESMVLEQNSGQEVLSVPQRIGDQLSGMVLQGSDKAVVVRSPQGVEVFPNPTTGEVLVRSSAEVLWVEVRDALGRRLMEQRGFSRQVAVDLAPLSNGSYILSVRTASGATHLVRITKQ